jgi:hypothetical protein
MTLTADPRCHFGRLAARRRSRRPRRSARADRAARHRARPGWPGQRGDRGLQDALVDLRPAADRGGPVRREQQRGGAAVSLPARPADQAGPAQALYERGDRAGGQPEQPGQAGSAAAVRLAAAGQRGQHQPGPDGQRPRDYPCSGRRGRRASIRCGRAPVLLTRDKHMFMQDMPGEVLARTGP